MEASEQDVRDYCRENGYDYDRLMAILDDDERAWLFTETVAVKNGGYFLDGFFSEPRYHWCHAMLDHK